MLLVASVVWGYHEYKDVWSERSGKFASAFASGMERLSSSHPRSLCTHGHAQLLSGSQEFYKNADKFGRGKILANDIQFAKFARVFAATILHYTVLNSRDWSEKMASKILACLKSTFE